MKYCLDCEMMTEGTQATTCPACGTVLRPLDALSPEDLDRPIVLTYCSSLFEAQVLRAALGSQGVDAIVEDEGLLEMVNPYHGGTDPQGSTRVMVRLEDAEAALDLLRRKECGELALTDEEPIEDGPAPPQ